MTTTNGTPAHPIRILVPDAAGMAALPLDAWDDLIQELDTATGEAEAARRELDAARRALDVIEARAVLAGLPGRNEGERKAALTVALLDDPAWRRADRTAQSAAAQQRAAERRGRLLGERIRLLRAAVTLAAAGGSEEPLV